MACIVRFDAEGFPIEQGSEAWKRLRLGLGTGSMAGDILPGKRGGYLAAREKLISETVAEILTGQPVSSGGASRAMRDGIEREPYARMAYMERTGVFIEEVAFVRHNTLRIGTSPDGLQIGDRIGLEIKSPQANTHVNYLLGEQWKDDYFAQIQHNLLVTGYPLWKFVSYCPLFPEHQQLLVVDVPRDEAFISNLLAEWAKFFDEVDKRIARIREITGDIEQQPEEESA